EFIIKKGKIRGEESFGVICAEDVLSIGESHVGIMILDDQWEVGTTVFEDFEIYSDTVFEIGLTHNRAEALNHWEVTRNLRAGLIQNCQQKYYSELITPSVSKFKVEKRTLKYDIVVEDSKQTPRYCGVTISGIEVKPSPAWLQNKLKAIGIIPKNNIVD